MRKLFLGAALAAATFVSAPSFAATTLSDEKASFEILTVENVSALLTEMGAKDVTTTAIEGQPVVRFTSGGIPFNFILLCDAGVCQGIYMAVIMITDGAGQFPLETLNSYNQKNPIVSVAKFEEKAVQIARVLITEGGVTKKNVAINMGEFASSADAAIKFLTSQFVASAAPNASPFDRVKAEAPRLRPVFMNPSQVSAVAKSYKSDHRASLR